MPLGSINDLHRLGILVNIKHKRRTQRQTDMTCVLSMSSVYNNPCGGFGGSKDDVTTETDYDYGWISATPPSSRLSDNTTCSCRFDNNNTTMCRTTAVLDTRLSSDVSQKQG